LLFAHKFEFAAKINFETEFPVYAYIGKVALPVYAYTGSAILNKYAILIQNFCCKFKCKFKNLLGHV